MRPFGGFALVQEPNPLFLDFSQDSYKPLKQRSRSVLDRELFLQIKSYMEIKHNTDKNQVGLKLMDGVGKRKREVISELPSLSSQWPPRLPDTSWNLVHPPKFSWKAPPDTVVSGLD